MPLAKEIRRAIIRNRRIQERRNAEAQAEEHARQAELRQAGKMRQAYALENKMLAHRGENKEVETAPEPEAPPPKPEAPTLKPVPFASARAETLATLAGLTAETFQGLTPSGAGGFTAADVRAVVAFKEGEE